MLNRFTLVVAVLTFALVATVPVSAQDFPSKPIRLVVPFAPGGVSDILARALAEKLASTWKQQVIVDNRPGAGGAVGTEIVARAPADGHTLLIADASVLTTNPSLYPGLSYTGRDLVPVINLATFGQILVAPAASPLQSIQDLLALDKARAARLNVASSGNGTSNHIALEKFKAAAKMDLTHVPYKGAGPAIQDVVGGHVDLMFTSGPLAQPLLAAGRIKALAVTSTKRMAVAPQAPTIAESGFPGFDWISAQGMFAPAGTPAEVVRRINADVAAAIRLPDIQARYEKMGIDSVDNTPAQFATWVAKESAEISTLIRSAAIKAD